MLKITVLGCGSSHGVPVVGCACEVCTSSSPYNKRRRSAIIIEQLAAKVLVDFGFDIKDQLVDAKIDRLDGAVLTHDHADHVAGIDNLRIFRYLSGEALTIHTDHETEEKIKQRYKYLFDKGEVRSVAYGKYDQFEIDAIRFQFFNQLHAEIDSLGIRVGDFVYSSDVREFPPESRQYLQGIKVWLLDCLAMESNHAHAGLDRVLEWNDKYKPKRIYLTNMRDDIDYYKIQESLPDNIRPAYDGLVIQI